MTTLKTIDLSDNLVMSLRDINITVSPRSIDINQTNGTYAVVEPYDSAGGYNGRVVIYPQSLQSEIAVTTELKSFSRVGSLYYPLDARFDYARGKIWIADAGNNRVLKIDLNTQKADLSIGSVVYPYSLASNLNNGGVFVKSYLDTSLEDGIVLYFKADGTELARFVFQRDDLESSSSSSSGDIDSSSSSSGFSFSSFPSPRSMVFDHVRSRLWWVDGVKVYMADIGNQQVSSYDLRSSDITDTISIDVDFESGNSFIVSTDNHTNRVLIQIFRDNNSVLGIAYIED
jgi:DNA-binding beta-propeller fold protein YncE